MGGGGGFWPPTHLLTLFLSPPPHTHIHSPICNLIFFANIMIVIWHLHHTNLHHNHSCICFHVPVGLKYNVVMLTHTSGDIMLLIDPLISSKLCFAWFVLNKPVVGFFFSNESVILKGCKTHPANMAIGFGIKWCFDGSVSNLRWLQAKIKVPSEPTNDLLFVGLLRSQCYLRGKQAAYRWHVLGCLQTS